VIDLKKNPRESALQQGKSVVLKIIENLRENFTIFFQKKDRT
jgi:hypothetical protein